MCDARLASGIDFLPITSPTTTTLNINIDASLLGASLGHCPIYRWPATFVTQQYSQPSITHILQACLPVTNNKSGRNLSLSRTSSTLPVTSPSRRPAAPHTRPAAGTTSSHHQKPRGAPGATEHLASISRLANQTWSNMVSTSTTVRDVPPWSDSSTAERHC